MIPARLVRRRNGPRGRGQALVEFALVLPIFLLLLMTLFDFGRVIYAQHTINQDAREGSRVGSVSADSLSSNASFTARYAAIRAAARVMAPAVPMTDSDIKGDTTRGCAAVTAAVAGATPPMPNDPTVAAACFYPNGVNNPNSMTTPAKIVVKIQVSVPLITPIVSNILGGSLSLSATSEELLK